MITIKEHKVVSSLEEAYELNQKRNNVILGGLLWLKMSKKAVQTAIDLSHLSLDYIKEDEHEFSIGCMTRLRQLEEHEGLNQYCNGAMKECLKGIVGVQFRNTATIGGSIYGRFGFSDPLTCLLAMDTYVELYKGGIVSLEAFTKMPYDNDILVRLIIKKTELTIHYDSMRNTATDFPVLTCAVSNCGGEYKAVIGARPNRAKIIRDELGLLTKELDDTGINAFADYVAEQLTYGSNMRASKEYRKHLANVYVKRGMKALSKKEMNASYYEQTPMEGKRTKPVMVEGKLVVQLHLNGTLVKDMIDPDMLLLDFVRKHHCLSVKRGCETANCGLCTVLVEGKPVLSCSTLTATVNGLHVTTMEGIQEEAREFGEFLADQGAEQCGFCSPGFIMNVIAMKRELKNPSEEEIKQYLAGNLCRCTGYMGQLRAIKEYLKKKEAKENESCK